jgi:hypothetical protein
MNDQQQMTTKRALLVVGMFIFLLMITLIAPAKWVGVAPKKHTGLVLKNANELAVLSKDTNRNNNPDWKDLLINTTSTSTQAIASKFIVTETDAKRLADPNNITASFSKNLYTVSSYAKQAGNMSLAEQESIVSGLVTKEVEKVSVTTYNQDNLSIASTETPASIKTYGNQLGMIFKKATGFKLEVVDFDKIQAFTVNNDPDTLATLLIKKNNTKTIISELLKVSVPKSAVPYHLLMVNRLSEYMTVLEGLTQANDDPMRATIAFANLAQTAQSLFSSLANMQLYFKLQDITFSNNEPGYVLDMSYTMK